jgi:protein TonB
MTTDYSFTSNELLMGFALGFLVLLAIVFLGRYHYARVSASGLTEKYRGKRWRSPLESRNKYPDVDVFRMRTVFLRLGLVGALTLIIGAFNWTTSTREREEWDGTLSISEDIEIEVPRSAEPPPPPPPPPPPVIEEIPNEMVLEMDEQIEFVDQSVDAYTAIEAPPVIEAAREAKAPPPPPPPPPPRVEEREIFKIVEQMPRFPGCEHLQVSEQEKKACADQKLLEFVYQNVRYPQIAKENGIEGTVVVQFVVNPDGTVSDITLVRDIGAKCGDEAVRLVKLMNALPEKWTPGKQRGRPVPVMFTMPIRFKLEYQ